jgi:hypothetical protein
MDHSYDIIFSGLAFDIVGAVILAMGFMAKRPQLAYFEAMTVVGANNHLLKSALLQRADAQVGASLLVLGFLLQIWGNLHGGIAATAPGWVDSVESTGLLVVVCALVAWVFLKIARSCARREYYRIIFRNWDGQELASQPQDKTWLARCADAFDLKRMAGEKDEEFFARLKKRHTELGARYRGQGSSLVVD